MTRELLWRGRFWMDRMTVQSRCFARRWTWPASDWNSSALRLIATSSAGSRRCAEQFGRLRFAVEKLSFVYTVKGYDGEDRVYIVKRGVIRAELDKPRTSWQREKLKRLAEEMFSVREPLSTSVPTHEIDELLLLSSSVQEIPEGDDPNEESLLAATAFRLHESRRSRG